jgi:uncharacterized protein (TIGR00255 family)
MTGQGDAQWQAHDVTVFVELRTLNSRYFKLTVRGSEGCMAWEPRIESVVRERIRRGTVQVSVQIDREVTPDRYRLNTNVLEAYCRQLDAFRDAQVSAAPRQLETLLGLPGVITEHATNAAEVEADWEVCRQALHHALDRLEAMRRDEGQAMAADLCRNCQLIRDQLDQIAERAPQVAEAYRTRLTERLNKLLGEYNTQVEPAEVVREVGTFAERSDISEEVFRLRSHLDQFLGFTNAPDSSGRKLDFLTQEMFREANTIGSKANDATIAGHVVEIKALIERMREMIQNIE